MVSIDTIAVSATDLTFANGGTLSATNTGLNLQGDGAVDVNLAGGNSATGCTVQNSTGNLTCTGNITGTPPGQSVTGPGPVPPCILLQMVTLSL